MKDSQNTIRVFVSSEELQSQLEETPPQVHIAPRDEQIGPEVSAAVEHPELTRVIQVVTELWPEQAFCLLNEQRLWQQAKAFQQHFLPDDPRQTIAYALKANPRARILEILSQAGITHADCASVGEINKIRQFSPQTTPLYTYPFRFHREIRDALQAGVRYFTVQTREEIMKILEIAEAQDIKQAELELAVRLRSLNADADIDLSQKFGTDEATVKQLLFLIDCETDASPGLSLNTGSQNRNPSTYVKAVKKLVELAHTVNGVSSINLGGGFPVNYHEGDQFSLEEYLQILSAAIQEHAQNILKGPQPRVIIEPGRALVAEAVDLIIPVRRVEEREGQKVVFIDDGVFTSFSDSIIHPGWKYQFEAVGKEGRDLDEDKASFMIFGRSCDSKDKLRHETNFPNNLRGGDYIIAKNSGAYTDSQSSVWFNGFSKPEYITYNLLMNLS